MTVWPRSCSSRSLFRTTVWPRWMSGAVGSSPSLMRSGTPVASERASLASHSCFGEQLAAAPLRHARRRLGRESVTRIFQGCRGRGKRGRHHWLLRERGSERPVYCARRPTAAAGRSRRRADERHDSSGAPLGDDQPRCRPQGGTDRTERRAPQKLKLLTSLDVAWDYASAHIASFASRYPRTLTATVSLGLAGFAATAFGIAPHGPRRRRPAAAHRRRDRRHRRRARRSSTPWPTTISTSTAATSPAPATRPIRCSRASTSAIRAPRRSCAATRSRASCSTAAAGKRVQVRVDSRGALEELIARYARARHRQAADALHAPARRAHRRPAGRRHVDLRR